QGLRLNRSLLSLSLANNAIGDAGATKLAEVLGPFALTHAEVVERRRLLLAEALGQSRTVSFPAGGRVPIPPPGKVGGSRGGLAGAESCPWQRRETERSGEAEPGGGGHREGGPEPGVPHSLMPPPSQIRIQAPDPAEPLHPLLEEARPHQGSVVLPGNRALLNLNLTCERGWLVPTVPPHPACPRRPSLPPTDNHVTERGLGAFLAALQEQQREKKPKVPGQQGLLCLSLEKNRIPPTSLAFARLQELLPPRDALLKAQGWEEEQELGT
ncbi:LRC71 protein, partial [Himantopus himantopus]|nr:LRC71 protein [Himantopus himantopus]